MKNTKDKDDTWRKRIKAATFKELLCYTIFMIFVLSSIVIVWGAFILIFLFGIFGDGGSDYDDYNYFWAR